MQIVDINTQFTASITAYDSSNNLIGEVQHSDATTTANSYSITPVGVTSLTPITSIVIKVVGLDSNRFAIGTLYFTPGKANPCSPSRERAYQSLPGSIIALWRRLL
jgi:hypothetical protein